MRARSQMGVWVLLRTDGPWSRRPADHDVRQSGGSERCLAFFRDAVGGQIKSIDSGNVGRTRQCRRAFVADLIVHQIKVVQASEAGPTGQYPGGFIVEVIKC